MLLERSVLELEVLGEVLVLEEVLGVLLATDELRSVWEALVSVEDVDDGVLVVEDEVLGVVLATDELRSVWLELVSVDEVELVDDGVVELATELVAPAASGCCCVEVEGDVEAVWSGLVVLDVLLPGVVLA